METIKYASLASLECPKCKSHDIKVDQVKSLFGNMKKSDAKLDISDFTEPEFESKMKEEYARIGIDMQMGLNQLMNGTLPLNRLRCQDCKYSWIPKVGTSEADPEDRLDEMAFIEIHRNKKMMGVAVNMLIMINGVLSPIELANGDTAIYPTMVKHNRVQYLYDKVSPLVTHTSTMKAIDDVEVKDGETAKVEVSAEWTMG